MLHRYIYIIMCLAAVGMMLAGCDHIAEEDRLIYVKPEPAKRIVLLEDFTGQRCPNCPLATDLIEQLQETYGDALVAVGIHGGPLGFAGTAKVVGLATPTGDEYYNHWQLEYQPVGVINRQNKPLKYSDWAAAVKEELQKPAPLWLDGNAVVVDGDIQVTIEAQGTDGTVTGKLQVWLLEDSITALQIMPDGKANQQYLHNHVFRLAVNGTWGEDFSIEEGKIGTRTMTLPLQPLWKPENLSIVAFVYNDSGVQQAVKVGVIKD